MDGLSVTCRTCGVRTSFDDAGTHVCRPPRFPQQQGSGYEPQQRPDDQSLRQRSPSAGNYSTLLSRRSILISFKAGRNQYPPRQNYADQPQPPRDDLTLGPRFDLHSIGSPHSYNGGPYSNVKGPPVSRGPSPNSRGPPPPRHPLQPNYNLPEGGMARPQTRNGPQYDPTPRQQYQQAPPRQQYMDDLDYSRRPGPPMRVNTAPLPYPPPPRDFADYDQPMKSPLFQRPNADLRGQQYREQRISPERRYPEWEPDRRYGEPEPSRDQHYDRIYGGNNSFRARSNSSYNNDQYAPPPQRNPSNSSNPSRNDASVPSIEPDNSLSLRAQNQQDEAELWSQIRSRIGKKVQSVDSSDSSESDTSRSRRSQETTPSSTSSPISPSKNTESLGPSSRSSPLKQTTNMRDHSRTPSDERPSASKISMPVCRACDEPIRGRSLASQDGKLTGRYHKRCFVCTTCQKPFETASFYVLQDRPYCKRHYHELNHSTCAACGEGVEGPCLQLEDCTVRHPACFTCHVGSPYPRAVLLTL